MYMSTDITIDTSPEPRQLTFDAFVTTDLEPVARAVHVAVDDSTLAANAINDALAMAHRNWAHIGYSDQAAQWLFATAIERCMQAQPTVSDRAVVAATYGLGWGASSVAQTLGISEADVNAILNAAVIENERADAMSPRDGQPGRGETATLGETATSAGPIDRLRATIQARAADVSLELPDTASLRLQTRRRQIRRRSAVALISLGLLALAGTQLATPRQVSSPPLQSSPTAAIEPTPVQTKDDEPVVDRLAVIEPPPTDVRSPQMVATTPQGDFVGVRSPTFRAPRSATFSTSIDGLTWEFAGRWPLNDYEFVKRFERVDGRYFALVDNALAPNPPNPIKIGMSDDLITWRELTLPVNDVAPTGLIYSAQVTSIAAVDDIVLVLVSSDIEIDYESLALVESYTCGSTATDKRVLIDLCNEGLYEIDTASLTLGDRLFISRNGGQFEEQRWPFDTDAELRLTSNDSNVHATTTQGVRIASSTTGTDWESQQGALPIPADDVIAVVHAVNGNAVGIRNGLSNPAQIFFLKQQDGSEQQDVGVIDLARVTGETGRVQTVDITHGIAGWLLTITGNQDSQWVLFSPDGQSWKTIDAELPASSGQQTFVGNDEVLVRSMVGTGPVLTRLALGD